MKTYKKGQKLISLTNDQGLECGKIYTFMGEELFNLPLMENSSHETKFLKVLDSSGKTHIITEKPGLFHDSRDTWSPEARAAALEARRRKARMRAKTPKEIESKSVEEVTTKRKSLSDTRGVYGLNEDRINHLQRNLDFLYENVYKIPLREEDFLPGGKYEQIAIKTLELEDKEAFKESLKENPDKVKDFIKNNERHIRAVINKIEVENTLYNKLKDDPLFSESPEPELRRKIRNMVRKWAETSGDSSKGMVAAQIVANKVFSIDGQLDHFSSRDEEVFKSAKYFANSKFGEIQAKFLRAQYESTQEYLKENGIKELVLFRGYGGDKETEYELKRGRSVEVGLQPMSSFSTSLPMALHFAEKQSETMVPAVIAVTVKADRILSTPRTGYGCTGEWEVVILGGKVKATVYSGDYDLSDLQSVVDEGSDLSDFLNEASFK